MWQLKTIRGAEISSMAALNQELEGYNTSHPKSKIALSVIQCAVGYKQPMAETHA